MERIIIDTDPGIDDCMAILLALGCEQFNLEAITLVFGNHWDMEIMSRNAAYLLQLAKHDAVIYKGCTSALGEHKGDSDGPRIHGENGLGNIVDPVVDQKYMDMIKEDKDAVDFLIDYCRENPGEISIITLGPLTNIGTAIQRDPNFPSYVKRIVSMGGAFNERGNVSPVAEANIANDPIAAKIVTTSPWNEYTMAPLNTTRTVKLDLEFRQRIKEIGPIGQFIYDITEHYINFLRDVFGETKVAVHDSSAVMYFINPDVFVEEAICFVDVETKGERTKGQTIADLKGQYKKDPNFANKTRILFRADEELFKNIYVDTIMNLQLKSSHE